MATSVRPCSVLVLAAVVALLAPPAAGVHYHDCGSKGATINSVNITPCGNAPTCVLIRGQDATIEIEFTSSEDTKSATSSVHGKVSGVPFFVPFKLPNDNACQAAGLSCPLTKGSAQHYRQSIAIERIYPAVNALVKWEIKDDQKGDIVCLMIPVKLQ